jgi:hypothetical protein
MLAPEATKILQHLARITAKKTQPYSAILKHLRFYNKGINSYVLWWPARLLAVVEDYSYGLLWPAGLLLTI